MHMRGMHMHTLIYASASQKESLQTSRSSSILQKTQTSDLTAL